MDTYRFTRHFSDLPIGNLARGYYLGLLNSKLPDSRQLTSDSTGSEVYETYKLLTKDQRETVDSVLVDSSTGPEFMMFVEDVAAVKKTQSSARDDYLKSKRKLFVLFSMTAIGFNSMFVVDYSRDAYLMLGEHYTSPTFEILTQLYGFLVSLF